MIYELYRLPGHFFEVNFVVASARGCKFCVGYFLFQNSRANIDVGRVSRQAVGATQEACRDESHCGRPVGKVRMYVLNSIGPQQRCSVDTLAEMQHCL